MQNPPRKSSSLNSSTKHITILPTNKLKLLKAVNYTVPLKNACLKFGGHKIIEKITYKLTLICQGYA